MVKKIAVTVDNLSEAETKRRKLIIHIQELYQKGISIHEIARITGKERKTVKKYLEGNPDKLCRSNKHGCLEGYQDFIIKSIQKGLTQSAIARELTSLGYTGTISNARQYICTIALQYGIEISKYSNRKARYNDDGTKKPKKGVYRDGMVMESNPHSCLFAQRLHPVENLTENSGCVPQFHSGSACGTCVGHITYNPQNLMQTPVDPGKLARGVGIIR